MLVEFLLEVFFIKIKLKGYLENITENTKELIDTKGIKNKDKITYIIENTKYKIELKDKELVLTRENNEFIHKMIFKENKTTETKYYIKELKTDLSLKILTTKLEIELNKILINYEIIDNDNKYIYVIEMSE